MKVIGIVGSPRKNGNTEFLTAHALKAVGEEGLDTELIQLAGLDIQPCNACRVCEKGGGECSIPDDVPPIYRKMKEAEGIILASPVYFGSASGLMKAFMERSGFMARFDGRAFAGKAGGPLVVARRAGKTFTFAQLTLWFQILGFFIPGSTYWNVAVGRERGTVESDEEGLRTAWNFGKNLALLVERTAGDKKPD